MDHVGSILGAASYYVVFEVQPKDGKPQVIATLREKAEERSSNGFRLMLELAKNLGEQDPVYKIFTQQIGQAQSMVKIETDGNAARSQYDIASKLYNGRYVEIDGFKFSFDSTSLTDSGPRFRLMEKAKGLHFNDLPEDTAEQKIFKKNLAKAYVTLEFYIILMGGEFDHDRHGYQMKVDGTEVRLFDHGAMSLHAPSTEDRKLLADVLFEGFERMQRGESIQTFLTNTVRQRAEAGTPSEYITTIQKGLLALSDYLRHMSANDIKLALQSAIQAGLEDGTLHSDLIEQAMMKAEAGGFSSGALSCQGEVIKIGQRLSK